jgi:hypothetical protein
MRNILSQSYSKHTYWQNVGILTAAVENSAEYGYDKRAYATLEALSSTKACFYKPPNGTVAFETRVRGIGTEDDQEIIQMMCCAGQDHYTLLASLTWNLGTQVYSGTIVFANLLTVGNKSVIVAPVAVQDSGGEAVEFVRYAMNTYGYDRFAFIMTTKAVGTSAVYIDVRPF